MVARELAAGAVSLGALVLSIALGAYVVGRRGAHTNARHGMLSGACTAVLFWAVTGLHGVVLVAVPLGMLAGDLAARAGIAVRNRAD